MSKKSSAITSIVSYGIKALASEYKTDSKAKIDQISPEVRAVTKSSGRRSEHRIT